MVTSTAQRFAIVTGASSGIGLELARRLAEEGYDLLIAADLPAIKEAGLELTQRGISCQVLQCDLSTRDGVEQLIGAAEEIGRPIDALVANAGIGLGHAFLDQNLDEALKVVHTNVDGTLILLHRLGQKMRSQGQGRILITGSIAGLMPGTTDNPVMGPGGDGYGWSKRTLVGYSEQMARHLASRFIRVNTIHPTNCNTHLLHNDGLYQIFRPDLEKPTREDAEPAFNFFQAMPIPYVEPEDIANLALFLASDESRYMTGSQIVVDMGNTAR